MQRPNFRLTVFIILLFAACSKSKNTPQTPVHPCGCLIPSYSMMIPGNYWVYQVCQLDSNYNTIDTLNYTDSMYVEKDTTISGNVYHKYWQPDYSGAKTYSATYIRDSAYDIVDNYGTIYFAAQDFSTIFLNIYRLDPSHSMSPADTAYHLVRQMADKDKVITVPAGTFTTSCWMATYYMNPYFAQFAPLVRKIPTRYAPEVGKISEVLPFYPSLANYTERRLLRYHL